MHFPLEAPARTRLTRPCTESLGTLDASPDSRQGPRDAIIDAAAHAWDPSASLGRPLEFDPAHISVLAADVAATCTDAARGIGLIQPPTELPRDGTDTEQLLSAAGRTIPCWPRRQAP